MTPRALSVARFDLAMPARRSLLLVEADDRFRQRLVRALCDRGYDAQGVGTYDEALRTAERFRPECVVIEVQPRSPSGLQLVRTLHAQDATIQIVALVPPGTPTPAAAVHDAGATYALTKPVDADEIVDALQSS